MSLGALLSAEQIDILPRAKPMGKLLLYGSSAFPVAHGDDFSDIPIATAEVGRGRICITTSKLFVQRYSKIFKAMTIWVSHGEAVGIREVFNVKASTSSIPDSKKVLVYSGGVLSVSVEEECLEFVQNGGGLIYAAYLGVKLLMNKKPYRQIPMSKILQEGGIALTGSPIRGNVRGFRISSEMHPQQNIKAQIDLLLDDLHAFEELGQDFAKMLVTLPREVFDGELSASLLSIMRKYKEDFHKGIPKLGEPARHHHHIGLINIANVLAMNGFHYNKSPNVTHFPGDFDSSPDLQCGVFSLQGRYKESYPTGFYLPAGESLLVKVTSEMEDYKDWSIQIGAHSDKLHKKDKLNRFPIVYKRKQLRDREMEIHSPHGGSIYMCSPLEDSSITVQLENVVQSPFFDKRIHDYANWKLSRASPGLWADIAGDHIVFTVPAKDVIQIEDLREFLEFWDEVVMKQNDLRGTDPLKNRRQWVVADKQPLRGAMHAGYPIVTHLNISDLSSEESIFNMPFVKKVGKWGMFHEVGHNMQRETWTYDGAWEVTNNIFSLYTMDVMTEENLWIHRWPAKKMEKSRKYLNRGAKFDASFAIMLYTQLAHHFGWSSYKKFFRTYEDPEREQPKQNKEKLDQWIIRFSRIVEYNLSPMFEFWGFKITKAVEEELSDFQLAFIDDEMCQLSPDRYQVILAKYGGEGKVVTSLIT